MNVGNVYLSMQCCIDSHVVFLGYATVVALTNQMKFEVKAWSVKTNIWTQFALKLTSDLENLAECDAVAFYKSCFGWNQHSTNMICF